MNLFLLMKVWVLLKFQSIAFFYNMTARCVFLLFDYFSFISLSVYSCFLDMSKAFERLNHDLLLSKLANKGLPTHFVRIFKSVYAQTTVKIRENESFSDSWRICRGVRQGGITSAFLFNIYVLTISCPVYQILK